MNIASISYPRLAASAAIVLAGLANAQSPSPRPEFEVASVKPNTAGHNLVMIRPPVGGRFTATNARLKMLIGLAYNVQNFEISGGPGWVDSDGYDIEAKAADSKIGMDQLRPMLQTLLENRFHLMIHRETKEVPVYALMATAKRARLPRKPRVGLRRVRAQRHAPPPPQRASRFAVPAL